MQLDRFTLKAQEALAEAQQLAQSRSHAQLEAEHLLLVLLGQDGGLATPILEKIGANPYTVRAEIDARLGRLSTITGSAQLSVSNEVRRVLETAQRESEKMGDTYVSTEHLLMALAADGGWAADLLKRHGVTRDGVLKVLKDLRGSQKADSADAEEKYQALKKFSRDLTELAGRGRLDPVIGRDDEIRRVIQVLSRRTKNNPVLIGEPGVGKTAIVEGLAQRIVSGDVPEGLKGKTLAALDIAALVAGAKFRGEFEERLKAVLKEISDSEGEIITFIDEMHTLVGAGGAEGAVDASNMLKPMLARGELRMIGATTLDEYRKYVEKDAAFERRFQPVFVGEPTVEDTIAILRGLKERYEVHHGVRIQDSALVAAALLSHRYIADRFLPDKAIDLVDEAGSRLRIEIDSMPVEIDVVERRIQQLEIERQALKKETDPASVERRETIEAELAELREQSAGMKAHWQAEKESIGQIRALKEQIEEAKAQSERAERDTDLGKAAELRYGTIPRPGTAAGGTERPPGRPAAGPEDAEGRGRRRGHRRGHRQVDRHPRQPPAGRRGGEAHPHGGAPPPACRRPGRRPGSGGERPAPRPRRPGRSATGPSAASSSWGPPEWVRQSSAERSPSSCSTTRRPWCAST